MIKGDTKMGKKTIQGKDTGITSFEAVKQPHSHKREQQIDVQKISSQPKNESPSLIFLAAVKSGNIQDQISALGNIYSASSEHRQILGLRKISRTQFLLGVQDFLACRGLTLCKEVRSRCLHK